MSLKTVKLETGLNCLADPCFIIEMNNSYYLAVAVLEYDQGRAGPNLMKAEGVTQVRQLFERGYKELPIRACPINSDGTLPYRAPLKQTAAVTAAAPHKAVVMSPWRRLVARLAIFRMPGFPRPPSPLPTPPPPPPSGSEPLGMQTEPPGMQTSP